MCVSFSNGMYNGGGGGSKPDPIDLIDPINPAQTVILQGGTVVPAKGAGNQHTGATGGDADSGAIKSLAEQFDNPTPITSPTQLSTSTIRTIYVVTGPIGAGKTTFANQLAVELGCKHFDSDNVNQMPAHNMGKYRIWVQQYAMITKLLEHGMLVVSCNGSPFCSVSHNTSEATYDFDNVLRKFDLDPSLVKIVIIRVGGELTWDGDSGSKSRMIGRVTRDPGAWGVNVSPATAQNKAKMAGVIMKTVDSFLSNYKGEQMFSVALYKKFGDDIVNVQALPDQVPDSDLVSQLVSKLMTDIGLAKMVTDDTNEIELPCKWQGVFDLNASHGQHMTFAYGDDSFDPTLIDMFADKSIRFMNLKLKMEDGSQLEISIPVDCNGFDKVHITVKSKPEEFPPRYFGELATVIRAMLTKTGVDYVSMTNKDIEKWIREMKSPVIIVEPDTCSFDLSVVSCKVLMINLSKPIKY